MAPARERAREGSATRGPLLPALLAAIVLLPLGILTAQSWTGVTAERSTVDKELHGIEYLRALNAVSGALAEAQTGEVTGRPAPRDTLAKAIGTATEVDRRLGVELRTTERWAALRGSIQALAAGSRDPQAAATAYAEPTSLLTALYRVVEINSTLVRDTDADVYFLADAATRQLPRVIAGIGRLGDAALLATARPTETNVAVELAVARSEVTGPTTALAEDLQAAVDNTRSQTLSANLLSRLDRFRRGIDALLPTAAPEGNANPARLADARAEAQRSATDLTTNVLREMDSLLATRRDSLTGDARLIIGLAVAAVLLAVSPLLLWVRARRRPPAGVGPAPAHERELVLAREPADAPR